MTRHRFTQLEADHLAFIRALPCVICGTGQGIEAAHVRYAHADAGKEVTGNSTKPDPWWTVPLCPSCHRTGPDAQHKSGEREWWARHGYDPDCPSRSILTLCLLLWSYTGDACGAHWVMEAFKEYQTSGERPIKDWLPVPQIEREIGQKKKGRSRPIQSPGFRKDGPKQKIPSRPMTKGRKLRG